MLADARSVRREAPVPTQRAPARLLGMVFALVLMSGAVLAQALPTNAQEALTRGQALMAEALSTYDVQYPDRPLWRQAFNEGRTAIELAPGHPEPLRFMAQAYSR